jgi:predicted nucleic acid-binding protein
MRVIKGSIWLTAFGELELTNAFELRLFRRELTVPEITATRSAFLEDLEGGVFWLKALPVVVFEKARQIARKRTARLGTRTLDVLHVASALVLGATEFYTFDRNQNELAAMEGLRVFLQKAILTGKVVGSHPMRGSRTVRIRPPAGHLWIGHKGLDCGRR